MNILDHVEAFRWHLIRGILVWIMAAAAIFVSIDWVYDTIILAPARQDFYSYGALCRLSNWLHLGDALCLPAIKIDFQVTEINGTFSSAINIAMIGGVMLSLPYLLWELWRFIKPALSARERQKSRGGILLVSFFFFLGAAFGYYLLAPFTFNFLASFTLGKSGMILYRPSVNDYVESLSYLIVGCGLAFEMPVLCYVLARIGLVTGTMLKQYFKFAFVVIMVVAAIITPSPDWTSQLLVAIPLLFLYWVSILFAGSVEKSNRKKANSVV